MFPDDASNSEPDATPESDSGWSGVAFNLVDRHLLIPSSQLIEVAVCRTMARVPAVQPWVAGLAGLRGQVLAVLDLHAYISGGEPMLRPSPATVLVFSRTDTVYYGLLCSEFYGIQKFEAQPDRSRSCPDSALESLVDGAVVEGSDARWVIDPSRLLADEQFMQFSAVEVA